MVLSLWTEGMEGSRNRGEVRRATSSFYETGLRDPYDFRGDMEPPLPVYQKGRARVKTDRASAATLKGGPQTRDAIQCSYHLLHGLEISSCTYRWATMMVVRRRMATSLSKASWTVESKEEKAKGGKVRVEMMDKHEAILHRRALGRCCLSPALRGISPSPLGPIPPAADSFHQG
jgi:hypothetical protein